MRIGPLGRYEEAAVWSSWNLPASGEAAGPPLVVSMTFKLNVLRRLSHPVWWEDVFPGALIGMPRAVRLLNVLLFGHP